MCHSTKYLGTTVTNQNLIQEVIERRMNSDSTFYQSVQSLLDFRLLSKIVKTRTYKSIILPVVRYGCETWSPTLLFVNHKWNDKAKKDSMGSAYSTNGERKNEYMILVGKTTKKINK
jgi:hypothetical protein